MTLSCKHVERADEAHGTARHDHADERDIVDTVTLDETDRHRRRFMLKSDNGIEFLLDLQAVTLLRHGDVLRLSDQRGIRVRAKPEDLYEVHGKDKTHLLMLTWHIGNRHLATQIKSDHVRIRRDPVIRNMLEQLGAQVEEIQAGFDPEGGAYGDTHAEHHHSHSHD